MHQRAAAHSGLARSHKGTGCPQNTRAGIEPPSQAPAGQNRRVCRRFHPAGAICKVPWKFEEGCSVGAFGVLFVRLNVASEFPSTSSKNGQRT